MLNVEKPAAVLAIEYEKAGAGELERAVNAFVKT